jgi:hypothetical protein
MKTTADLISGWLGNDGQCLETDDGQTLDSLCDARAVNVTRDGDSARWVFDDGSVITAHGCAWDLGYRDCWCWQGAGHREDCEEI